MSDIDVNQINDLAQHIRQVNGNNDMGAAKLAESIMEWQARTRPTQTVAAWLCTERNGSMADATTSEDSMQAYAKRGRTIEPLVIAHPAPSQAVRSGVPELTSGIVNDCCWTFVEAMPHTLPGPIFNDVKPALYAAIKQYHETVLSTTPQPAAQAPDGYVLVEKGITPTYVADAGLKCFRLLNQSGIADDRTIVLSVFQDMLLAASNPPAEGEEG